MSFSIIWIKIKFKHFHEEFSLNFYFLYLIFIILKKSNKVQFNINSILTNLVQAKCVDNSELLLSIESKNLYVILYINKVHSSIILYISYIKVLYYIFHNFFINLTSESCTDDFLMNLFLFTIDILI